MNDMSSLIAAALQALGILLVHRQEVEAHIASGRLEEVLEQATKTRIPLYIYYRRERSLDRRIKAFVEHFSFVQRTTC